MESQTKVCQFCKKDFIIESDDFAFYEKMRVPPPTFCPECQAIRQMTFRNENKLYRRTNNDPEAESSKLISMFSEDKDLVVYDHKSWWGDSWDSYSYGKDYDFSRPFFEQMKELIKTIPWPNLINWNSVNSDYCNYTTDNKNCYLVFGGDFNENCSYSKFNFHSRDSQDLFWVNKSDLCYECIDVDESYRVSFSQYSKGCSDSMFLFDCINCNYCIGCVNLRNKSHCIFNKQYTKEEYINIINEYKLDTRTGIELFKNKFLEFKLKFPHKYANIIKSIGCTGNNIIESKNCINCFEANTNCKDLKNVNFAGWGAYDSRSTCYTGHNSELVYDSLCIFSKSHNIKFSLFQPSSMNLTYVYNCPASSNLFGCVGIKKGNYAILNKQYTKEQYEELIPKIIKHMNDMPYIDSKGRIYKYGEFLPSELSPFAYNETVAFDYYPLTKEEAISMGYSWKDQEEKDYNVTIPSDKIPEKISEVSDEILDEVIGCEHYGKCNDQCSTAFKIIPEELNFYKRMNLPLPNLCPNCRHYNRLKQRSPLKLWHRSCMNTGCTNEFETSYAPDRPEIIYCEKCYQQEVY